MIYLIEFIWILVKYFMIMYLIYYYFKNELIPKFKNQDSSKSSIYVSKNIDLDYDIYPYKSFPSLMSTYEQKFFLILSMALNDKSFYICPKVRLCDIVQVISTDNYQFYLDKIKTKHIDYLICDKFSFRPLYAISLDDLNFNFQGLVIKEDFLNNCFSNSDIKFVRFKTHYSYKVTEIKEILGLLAPTEY